MSVFSRHLHPRIISPGSSFNNYMLNSSMTQVLLVLKRPVLSQEKGKRGDGSSNFNSFSPRAKTFASKAATVLFDSSSGREVLRKQELSVWFILWVLESYPFHFSGILNLFQYQHSISIGSSNSLATFLLCMGYSLWF